ncbi:eotaxin-like isoform X1 [Centropristis striata]|uniref:eotaxin-like isoform X1 n=1 Tax=Centropristis striata TaxID=184440 RepID=UPI0027E0BBEE|nr:eotaxin-like isoform X1 [Centropristis striata]
MTFSLVYIALLGFTTWMSVVDATHVSVSSCCQGWSNTLQRVALGNIVDYTKQTEGTCPLEAIVFETRRGIKICSDPDSDRAKKAMQKVDEKKIQKALQEKGHNEEGSTSTITSAVSSTSTNAPQKKGRYGRRRLRRKLARKRKGQRKRV